MEWTHSLEASEPRHSATSGIILLGCENKGTNEEARIPHGQEKGTEKGLHP